MFLHANSKRPRISIVCNPRSFVFGTQFRRKMEQHKRITSGNNRIYFVVFQIIICCPKNCVTSKNKLHALRTSLNLFSPYFSNNRFGKLGKYGGFTCGNVVNFSSIFIVPVSCNNNRFDIEFM